MVRTTPRNPYTRMRSKARRRTGAQARTPRAPAKGKRALTPPSAPLSRAREGGEGKVTQGFKRLMAPLNCAEQL